MAAAALILVVLLFCGVRALVQAIFGGGTPGAGVTVPDYVKVDLLPENPYSRPGTALKEINGVVIHYVGNPNTSAAANRSYFGNLALTHETYASAHFLVGLEGEIIQCVPLTEIAYCSNKRNEDTIAIEVCHPDAAGKFNPETQEALEQLTAWLCLTFDLKEEEILRHYDINEKICPKYYVENPDAWTDLLSGIKGCLEELKAAQKKK